MDEGREKRKVFRLNLNPPLCAEFSISQLDNLFVESGVTKICILNLSAIGLSFVSTLKFPIKTGVIYKIKLEILNKELEFSGIILWKRNYGDDLFRYGVTFLLDGDELKEYIQLFNQFSIYQKRSNIPLESCSYCKKDSFPCR